jgi:hypothetical protein
MFHIKIRIFYITFFLKLEIYLSHTKRNLKLLSINKNLTFKYIFG